jgi:hypothetical protein
VLCLRRSGGGEEDQKTGQNVGGFRLTPRCR